MKAFQKYLILVSILLTISACILPGKKSLDPVELESPDETPTSTAEKSEAMPDETMATESITEPAQAVDPCAELNLTPEECSNIGTHTYEFRPEFTCRNVESHNIEKLILIFSDSSVQIQKVEPVDQQWTYEFEKVSENIYVRETGEESEKHQITLEFIMNGFTSVTTVPELENCGQYIRTIISD